MLMVKKVGFINHWYGKSRQAGVISYLKFYLLIVCGGKMTKKKLTRKELLKEPDQFMTFSGKLFRFAREHKPQIIYGILGVVVVILAITAFRYFSDRAENRAFMLLEKSMGIYAEVLDTKDPQLALLAVEKDFDDLFNKYGKKDGGRFARLIFANMCFDAGEIDKSIDLYHQSLEDFSHQPSLRNFVLSGLAHAYQAKRDDVNAAKYFESIIEGPGTALKDDALFNLGILYAKMGQKQKSDETFEKLVSDYSDSIYIEIAKEKTAG